MLPEIFPVSYISMELRLFASMARMMSSTFEMETGRFKNMK